MTKVSDFIVNSKGYCFICLIPSVPLHSFEFGPEIEVGHVPIEESPSIYSLQIISRYLQMDVTKVFNSNAPVPPRLLAKVKRSKLKVELCQSCANFNENLSKLLRQLQKIELEVTSHLQILHGKLAKSEEVGRLYKISGCLLDENEKPTGQEVDILNVLRKEAMRKCSYKLGKDRPRIKVLRLTPNESRKYKSTSTSRSNKKTSKFKPADLHCRQDEFEAHNNIKNEIMDRDNDQEYQDGTSDDGHFEDECLDNSDGFTDHEVEKSATGSLANSEYHERVDIKEEVQQTTHLIPKKKKKRSRKSARKSWKHLVNPATGKYKCSRCPKEFKSTDYLSDHVNNIHLKVRFKCEKCSSSFSLTRNLRAHQQRCGKVGPSPKIRSCHNCGKGFTRTRSLTVHVRTVHLGIRAFQCDICGMKFKQTGHLTFHKKGAHSMSA